MSELTILGLAELDRALQDLPAKIEQNILRGGLRAGAQVIEAEAQRLVPADSGALRDTVRVSVRAMRGMVRASIKAGGRTKIRKTKAGEKKDLGAFYAHMVEFGTARHFIKPKNRKSLFFAGLARTIVEHPGARAKPFMRPAFDSKAQGAIDAMADYIRARLPRELARVQKAIPT